VFDFVAQLEQFDSGVQLARVQAVLVVFDFVVRWVQV
jgi:hypothetical protein